MLRELAVHLKGARSLAAVVLAGGWHGPWPAPHPRPACARPVEQAARALDAARLNSFAQAISCRRASPGLDVLKPCRPALSARGPCRRGALHRQMDQRGPRSARALNAAERRTARSATGSVLKVLKQRVACVALGVSAVCPFRTRCNALGCSIELTMQPIRQHGQLCQQARRPAALAQPGGEMPDLTCSLRLLSDSTHSRDRQSDQHGDRSDPDSLSSHRFGSPARPDPSHQALRLHRRSGTTGSSFQALQARFAAGCRSAG